MTTWDRFMLSFIFSVTVIRILLNIMLMNRRHEEEKHIKYMGTKKLSEEEIKDLMKFLDIHEMPDDDEEEDKE